MTSEFNPKDIGPNDYVVVLAPKVQDEECWFHIPKIKEKVWVARVHAIRYNPHELNPTYSLAGWFAYNSERDLTKPLLYHDNIEYIDFEECALVCVMAYEDNFTFTNQNIKELRNYIRKLPFTE